MRNTAKQLYLQHCILRHSHAMSNPPSTLQHVREPKKTQGKFVNNVVTNSKPTAH